MNIYPEKVSLEIAGEIIRLETVLNKRKLSEEIVSIREAKGRVLKDTAKAISNVPAFNKSSCDGYAVRREDIKNANESQLVKLRVVEEISVGKMPVCNITQGCTSKIMTGAAVPTGADTIIPVEQVKIRNNNIYISKPAESDLHITKAGQNLIAGTVVAKEGQCLTPEDCAMLKEAGYEEIAVCEKLQLGILCTGDCPEQMVNANDVMLTGTLSKEYIEVIDYGTVEHQIKAIASHLEKMADECSCIITTGGNALGKDGVMAKAIEAVGGTICFWQVSVKPGASMIFAIINGKPVFALPDNPVAAMTMLHMVALPGIRRMAGLNAINPERIQVKILEDYKSDASQRQLVWGQMVIKNGEAFFVAAKEQEADNLSAIQQGRILADIHQGMGDVSSGEIVFAYDLEHFAQPVVH